MRLHSGCLLPFAALLALSLNGCHYLAAGAAVGAAAGVATTPPEPPAGSAPWSPGTAVTIDFTAPRELVAGVRGQEDSVRVRDVTRVVGRVEGWHGDTLMLTLTQVRRASGDLLAFGRRNEPTTRVVPDPAARVRTITLQSPASRGLLGAGAGVVLAVIGVLVYCTTTTCLN